MNSKKNIITVFEHESLYVHKGDKRLAPNQLKALQLFYKETNFSYYSLLHNGVKFCEYVGVLQIGNMTIEILPKADKKGADEWRRLLIDMLYKAGIFDIEAPTSSALKIKPNSILDLYFELFIQQTESILHRGLIKQYRKVTGNLTSLKGSILFGKHIQKNLVHQELFYTKHNIYDQQHTLNCILYKTIKLLKRLSNNIALNSRIGSLLLNFPEMSNVEVSESKFSKINYNRKTEHYKQAIGIAKLLLLNFHPDVTIGKNDLLALLFDMNVLWERFVVKSLQKGLPDGYKVKAQSKKLFWKRENGYTKKMIPDIVINQPDGSTIVLDTKWKNIGDWNPSDADLRQMYAYSKYHQNALTALVYPNENSASTFIKGNFYNEETNGISNFQQCGIIKLSVAANAMQWQKEIPCFILQAMNQPTEIYPNKNLL